MADLFTGNAADRAAIRQALAVGPRLLHVGTRMGVLTNGPSNGTNLYTNNRARVRVPVACHNPRLAYVAWKNQSSAAGEGDLAQSIPLIKAGFEPTWGANAIPVFVSGKATGALDPGGTLLTDPIGVALAAGSDVGIRTHQELPSGGIYWGGRTPVAALGEGGEASASNTDKSLIGTISAAGGSGPMPVLLLAEPADAKMRAVAILGDSIPTGSGDTVDQLTGLSGFAERALNLQVPSAKFSVGGTTFASFQGRRYCMTPLIKAYFTDIIFSMGVNNLAIGLPSMQATVLAIAEEFTNAGLRFFACTIGPIGDSTDGCTSIANQTPRAQEATRVGYNDWLRTLPAPFAGVFDTALAMESGLNSGKFKLAPNARVISDGAITASQFSLTSATANFTDADIGTICWIPGAGAAGVGLAALITARTNATTVTIGTAASTTVSGAAVRFGSNSLDMLHPGPQMHNLMAACIDPAVFL